MPYFVLYFTKFKQVFTFFIYYTTVSICPLFVCFLMSHSHTLPHTHCFHAAAVCGLPFTSCSGSSLWVFPLNTCTLEITWTCSCAHAITCIHSHNLLRIQTVNKLFMIVKIIWTHYCSLFLYSRNVINQNLLIHHCYKLKNLFEHSY